MGDGTAIEWTDATWNPLTGCSVVSPGCTNCYAMKLAGGRLRDHPSRAFLTEPSKAGPVWNGKVRFNEAWLDQPLRWQRPRRVFVCAHSDLFHESVPFRWLDRIFQVMKSAESHTFQVLTKRAERMHSYMNDTRLYANLPNVWLGVSVEDQQRAHERIPHLIRTPAAVRFLSVEPMLGPVDLERIWFPMSGGEALCDVIRPNEDRIDWVIAGGESGPGARPMHPAWARAVRDQCQAAGVPFFFKQWGSWLPGENRHYNEDAKRRGLSEVAWHQDGTWGTIQPETWQRKNGYVMWEPDGTMHGFGERTGDNYFRVAHWATNVGKKRAGRELDGRTWDEMPA